MMAHHLRMIEVPASKFLPPRFDSAKVLYRTDILMDKLHQFNKAQFIFIEAQAGQGKTTLALQFIESQDLFYIWFQVGPEDQDPMSFFNALLLAVRNAIPGFSSRCLSSIKTGGSLSLLDLPKVIGKMVADIDRILDKTVLFVFDDLHNLEESKQSLALLDLMFEIAPVSFRFLLLSRRPIRLKSKRIRFENATLYLTDEDIALNVAESVHLHYLITQKRISYSHIQQLHNLTEGWVMGFVLLSHGFNHEHKLHFDGFSCLQEGIKDYFLNELFSGFSLSRKIMLVSLSLLEEIPLNLAESITGNAEVGAELTDLMNRNFFVRILDDSAQLFGFHHLFREFLRHEADGLLSISARQTILSTAAIYWMERGFFDKTMRCYAQAGMYLELEKILPHFGMELVAQSRLVNLDQIIRIIPEDVISGSGWLTFFKATLQKETDIVASGQSFEHALEIFKCNNDWLGELVTLSQIIYYHVLLSGTLATGNKYLSQATEIYTREVDNLSIYNQIITSMNIGTGFLYFTADMKSARKFLNFSVQLAELNNCALLAIQGRVSLAYTYMLVGNSLPAAALIERNYFSTLQLSDSLERVLTKYVLEIDFLHVFGDHVNFHHNLDIMVDRVGKKYLGKTAVWPLSKIWQANCAIASGRLDDALNVIKTALLPEPQAMPAHLESELLRLLSFIASFMPMDEKEVLEHADRALMLRKQAGGTQFELFTYFMLGLVYVRAGKSEKGMQLLDTAVEISEKKKLTSVCCSSYFFRAYSLLLLKRESEAERDLAAGLKIMHDNTLDFFWGWYPPVMQFLLEYATARDIEREFCQDLARKRLGIAIFDDGDSVPLLTIQILGDFSLEIAGNKVAQASDFTPIQRNLLSLILSSRYLQLNQEKIQAKLWPDKPIGKARASFDTLLFRFRKSLSKLIKPYDVRHYIVLSNGILSLQNSRIDAREFAHLCQKGLVHFRRKEFWQAGNSFYPAMKLWQGCFSEEIFSDDKSYDYCDKLQYSLTELASKWCENLLTIGYEREALNVLKKAWDINRTHEGLVKQLYTFFLRTQNISQARRVLKQYATILKQEEFTEEEIKDLIAAVSDRPC